MRIGINTLFYIPGEVGGSETYLCETLKAMLEHVTTDDYILFTNTEGHARLQKLFGHRDHVSLCAMDFRATHRVSRIIREQLQLPAAVKREGVDVLWSPGYTAPLRCTCPQVLSILDMQYKTHPQDLSLPARITTDILVQRGVKAARRVIAISEFSKSEIVKHTGIGPEKIDVTPLAADQDFATATPRPTHLAKPYILCVANSYPHKHMEALVAAYAALQPEIPHDLVIVGKARLGEPAVQTAMRDVPDPVRVKRIAGLERQALIALYQHADLFVFPSRYEGFGLPVLEAMLAGTPVLTTRKASIPEVGGEDVTYFDPDREGDLAACIELALTKPDTDRIARARARAATFTWARTGTLTLDACRRAATPA